MFRKRGNALAADVNRPLNRLVLARVFKSSSPIRAGVAARSFPFGRIENGPFHKRVTFRQANKVRHGGMVVGTG